MLPLLSFFALSLFPQAEGPVAAEAAAEATRTPAVAVATRRHLEEEVALEGVLVPAREHELAIWPEAYAGELVLLEVGEHGAWVEEGDVVATFEPRWIDDEIRKARRALDSAQLAQRLAVDRARIEDEEADERLRAGRAELERARRELDNWRTREQEFRRRRGELTARSFEHALQDQRDELEQLQAMYDDDELVDATEEIVLRRARRELSRLQAEQRLALDRLRYEDEEEVAISTERKQAAVETQQAALERLERSLRLDANERADRLRRGEEDLAEQRDRLHELERDREALVLRAPRSGVLLHGGAVHRTPGAGEERPEHGRGDRVQARSVLLSVAEPERLDAVLLVPESRLEGLRDGMGVTVRKANGSEGASAVAHLELGRYPTASSSAKPEAQFPARARLDGALAGAVAGLHVRVLFALEPLSDVLVLPSAAIAREGDSAWCWAESAEGEFVRQAVQLGPARGSDVVVTGGLEEGTRVLVAPPHE